jgi:ATP-binding cassette subfamily B protein
MMAHSRRRVQRIHKDFQSAEGDVSGRVADLLRGNKAVKLYAMEAKVLEDFERQALFIGRKSYERDVLSHVEWMKQEGFSYVCYVALMALCAWRAYRGAIGIGVVVSCFTSFQGLYGPLQLLFQSVMLWAGAAASLERIGKVLDTASTTPDPTDPVRVVPSRGAIEFAAVTFAYEPDRPVLFDIDLVIPYGQKVALVGPSGAGKTTVASLIPRFWDVTGGRIVLDGVDIRQLSFADLRGSIGLVPQEPALFSGTVRENIAFGRPDAPQEDIERAARAVGADGFIEALEHRYDTEVGERGVQLSAGQRQLIAFARALVADPRILVLDEATSNVDVHTETIIEEGLRRLVAGRTAIVIAHRLSTIRHAGRIVVLEHGRVVEQGTHDELLEAGGYYWRLYRDWADQAAA